MIQYIYLSNNGVLPLMHECLAILINNYGNHCSLYSMNTSQFIFVFVPVHAYEHSTNATRHGIKSNLNLCHTSQHHIVDASFWPIHHGTFLTVISLASHNVTKIRLGEPLISGVNPL